MKSDDLISRSKLIKDLLNARKNETNTIPKLIRFIYERPCEPPIFLYERDIKRILLKDDVKKIEVYPDDGSVPKVFCLERRGRWIEEDDPIIRGHCSCCKWATKWQENDVFKSNYCPNCGARMNKE